MSVIKRVPVWEARPMPARVVPAAGESLWGIVYLPTGQWMAFGHEARCRTLVTRLAWAAARPAA